MEFEKLKNTDKIMIKGKTYEILWNQKEITKFPEGREYFAIALHNISSSSLEATNLLRIFLDNKEIFLDSNKLNKEDIKIV